MLLCLNLRSNWVFWIRLKKGLRLKMGLWSLIIYIGHLGSKKTNQKRRNFLSLLLYFIRRPCFSLLRSWLYISLWESHFPYFALFSLIGRNHCLHLDLKVAVTLPMQVYIRKRSDYNEHAVSDRIHLAHFHIVAFLMIGWMRELIKNHRPKLWAGFSEKG